MKNKLIAEIFRDIAEILEIKGENPFRIRAYERASRNIESLPDDVEALIKENRLKDVDGIGKDLEEKIKEIASTGKLKYLEELKRDVPEGLIEMLNVPGIGPKTAKLLYEKLDIQDVVMLERMAAAGKIRGLEGMGEKTEENILAGIELFKKGRDRLDLKIAMDVADGFVTRLGKLKEVKKISPAGSLRRMKESVRDIDILISSNKPQKIMEVFTTLADVKNIIAKGLAKSSVLTKDDIQVDVRAVDESSYGAALMYFTGSKEHNIKLRQLAIKNGLKLNEYGIFKGEKIIAGKREEDIYKVLGISYIAPELREDRGEVEAGLNNALPDLVELKDIKGDLHAHSTWSDGGSSIEEVVIKAGELGYEYIGITDHSQGLRIAGGLDTHELDLKRKEIERLNKKYENIKILFGSEVDIDSDGNLDYPDDVLREMDIVIGAIHVGFKQSREAITKRIIKACRNKYVSVIAHPTGRLWGSRDAYDVNFEEVFKAAKDTGTALEINSFPQRLDLNDINSRMAKDAGVKIVINTDSHLAEHLSMMKFGVAVARRGWLEKKDVLNTASLNKLKLKTWN
ncbi:MAG: DNA polymerase/3'-5' exonuclease PolX [Candidatus Omnitrophica bacterium]|nr:DNA polymerase/3'-5' exonuclease PolX [Candidatus Omnitrophota bacterium]